MALKPEAVRERDSIVAELNQIIRGLDSAASDLRATKGIGAERAIWVLGQTANKYRSIRWRLLNLR